jgi:hypothetical protein
MKSVFALVFAVLLPVFSFAHGEEHGGGHHGANSYHLIFKGGAMHIHADFEVVPAVGTDSVLRLTSMNGATHTPMAFTDDVEVVLWMPSMGHGSSPTQVERIADASGNIIEEALRVRNVYFIMGGDWEVRVTLKSADGTTETQSFALNVAGGGHHH